MLLKNGIRRIMSNKFSGDFIWNVMALGVTGVSGLLLNTVILAGSGKEALGVFNQVLAIFVIASQLTVFGVQFSVLKHCSWQQETKEECRRQTVSGLLLTLVISTVLAGILYFLAPDAARILKSSHIAPGVRIIAVGIVFFSMNKILASALNGLRHMKIFALTNASRFSGYLLLTLILMATGLHYQWFALAITATEIVIFGVLSGYVIRRVFPLSLRRGDHPARLWREHLHFGARGFLSGFLIEANTRTDILMLGWLTSETLVGIYSFSAVFAEGFAQLITIMRNNLDPLLGKYFADGDCHGISGLGKKVRKYFYPLMLCGGLVLCLAFPVFLKLIPGTATSDWQSYWYVLLILVAGFVLISGYHCFIGIFIQGGRPGLFSGVMSVALGSNVILNLILIPRWGIYGAAVATALSYGIQPVCIIAGSRYFFKVKI